MSLISIQNLTFCHEGSWQPVFENLSLQLDSSWRLGLVGRNGRGKSTLLGLLCGRWPYRGSINAGVQFEYFPFLVPDPEQMALYAVQDCRPGLEQWQLERELNRMGADPDMLWQPFATLSQGQRTKLLLAALFCTDNAFLLIDEPTNHLDVQGRRQLAGYLAGKQGFILVSHDRDFLDSCTDHTLAINRGSVELVAGSYSVWRQQRQLRDESELAQNARLKKDIARLEQSARQAAGFAQKAEKAKKGQGKNNSSGLRADRGFIGAQAARLMKRAKSIEARRNDAVEQKQQLLRDIEQNESLILRPLDFHSPVLAEAKGTAGGGGGQRLRQEQPAAAGAGPAGALYRVAAGSAGAGDLLAAPERRGPGGQPGGFRPPEANSLHHAAHLAAQAGLCPPSAGRGYGRFQRRAKEKSHAGRQPLHQRPPIYMG